MLVIVFKTLINTLILIDFHGPKSQSNAYVKKETSFKFPLFDILYTLCTNVQMYKCKSVY